MTKDQERALALRTQAMNLLEEAFGLDHLQPFVVTHSTDKGSGSSYVLWSKNEPKKIEEASAVLDFEFEPDKGESLTVETHLTLSEMTGVSPSSRLEEIMALKSESSSGNQMEM